MTFLDFKLDRIPKHMKVNHKVAGIKFAVLASMSLALVMPMSASAFDEDAARALAKRNDCFKCHAVDKTKKGPSYKKIAAKYKGKADTEQKMIEHLKTSPKVKLEDGTEEEHKAIDTKDQKEIKNLLDWILAQ